jgi:nitrite reductase/ring-hydroxylating ferredoxin subunit
MMMKKQNQVIQSSYLFCHKHTRRIGLTEGMAVNSEHFYHLPCYKLKKKIEAHAMQALGARL